MAVQEGAPEKGLEFAKRLPRPILDPGLASNIGTAHYSLNDLEKAEPYYRRAIALEPFDARLYRNLGDLLLKKGSSEEAMGQFQLAVEHQTREVSLSPTSLNSALLLLFQSKAGDCETLFDSKNLPLGPPQWPALPLIYAAQAFAVCQDQDTALTLTDLAVRQGFPPQQLATIEELQPLEKAFTFKENRSSRDDRQ